MRGVKVGNFFGGIPIQQNKEQLKKEPINIVVGTPGRVKQLAKEGALNLKSVRHFVLDECDKMLEKLGERKEKKRVWVRMLPCSMCLSRRW